MVHFQMNGKRQGLVRCLNWILSQKKRMILNNFSEIFKPCLHEMIFKIIVCTISTNQHGFIPQKSVTSNLLIFTQKIEDLLVEYDQDYVIFTQI